MATYRILALDDMEIRHKSFRQWFKDHTLDEAFTAPAAIDLLNHFDYDVVMLDHDLAEEHYLKLSEGLSEGRLPGQDEYAPGTGQDVAKHIVSLPLERRPKLVLVHTWNPGGRAAMYGILRDAGIAVIIKPFNSLDPVVLK